MTIIEVLIALSILALTLSLLTTSMISNTQLNTKIDRRGQAIRVAEQVLEGFRESNNYASLVNRGVVNSTVTFNNYTFPVKTTFCPSNAPSQMPCSNTAVFIRVEVMDNNKVLYKSETYYSLFGKESQ